MSTALAVQSEMNLDEMQRTASLLAASGYFDAKGDPKMQIAQLATKIMAGRELGYGPYTAVQGIHIIQGKPQVSANLMAAAVKGHPRYDYRVLKMANDEVVIRFFEDGKPIGDSAFTIEDATAAGTQNIKKYPRNMLFARALSNGVRWYCPDVFAGNSVYVEGEIGAEVDEQPAYIIVDRASGEVIESPEPPPSIEGLDDVDPMPFSDRPDWKTPQDAKNWAIEVGACANEFEATNSLKKIVDAHGGRLLPANIGDVFDAFHARQMEKLAEAQSPEGSAWVKHGGRPDDDDPDYHG
jgi:hypothetical protein